MDKDNKILKENTWKVLAFKGLILFDVAAPCIIREIFAPDGKYYILTIGAILLCISFTVKAMNTELN